MNPLAMVTAIVGGATVVGVAFSSAAAALVVFAYGLAALYLATRARARRAQARRQCDSLNLLAASAADLRAGVVAPMLLLPDPALDRLARAAQRISDRTGAPLADLLERMERQQRELARAESAAWAQAAGIRLTAGLLAALPLMAIAMGHAIGADALGMLFGTPLGLLCAALAVALQLAGLAWADRLGGQKALPLRRRRGLRRLTRTSPDLSAHDELAASADLMSAALRAGVPISTAVLSTGEAMAGPLTRPLLQIGHQLRLGVSASVAWQQLAEIEEAKVLVDAAKRTAQSGAALSGALTRCADDLRANANHARQARLQRSAVLLVLPLGLCFLPAFLLAGLVPVVVAVLGEVL